MKQEEKQLLIKDLCARVPYVTFVYVDWHETEDLEVCEGYEDGEDEPNIHTLISCDYYGECDLDDNLYKTVYDIKPYLRPISSMTEEEKADYHFYCETVWDSVEEIYYHYDTFKSIDWLNEHHFDYRGLIPIGLALEAPEDMYKTE